MKRRKKTSSISDLSSGSLSPSKRQFYSNNYPEENQSSSDISPYSSPGAFNDIFRYSHSLSSNETPHRLAIPQTSTSTTIHNAQIKSSTTNQSVADYQNGDFSAQHYYDKQSKQRHLDATNINGTDSDSNASVNVNVNVNVNGNNGKRQPRTTEDFYLFCEFILQYANYDGIVQQDVS